MMSHKKYVVEFSSNEREHLKAVISKGKTFSEEGRPAEPVRFMIGIFFC